MGCITHLHSQFHFYCCVHKTLDHHGTFRGDMGDVDGNTTVYSLTECSAHQRFQIEDGYVEDEESDYKAFVKGTNGRFEGGIVAEIWW